MARRYLDLAYLAIVGTQLFGMLGQFNSYTTLMKKIY